MFRLIFAVLILVSFHLVSSERCVPDASMLIGSYRRQCNDDGTWTNPQCWGSIGQCWCVDPETGEQIGERTLGYVDCQL